MPSYALGIDIGGTFTDIVVYDHDSGRQWSRKVLTTHDDPVRAVAAGVATVLADGHLEPRHFTRVVHATTLFTNALIERKGARTGLITTRGFRDNLELRRERKYELYDLNIENPPPLVSRDLRLEVDERVDASGAVLRALDQTELLREAAVLAERGVTSIAIVFLHSYANATHERAAGALAAAHFGGDARNLLAFDMGGTTAKLSLIDDGEPLVAYGFEAARQKRFTEGSGLPIRISTIELIEIGAGGGSIAHTDEIGLLKVGPRSAGSHPGPAAYGLGGGEPTVTDADFLLGYLNPQYFAGGEVTVDLPAARAAVERLAARVGLSPTETAWGIHDVVNENMAGPARDDLPGRGGDPRHYPLP